MGDSRCPAFAEIKDYYCRSDFSRPCQHYPYNWSVESIKIPPSEPSGPNLWYTFLYSVSGNGNGWGELNRIVTVQVVDSSDKEYYRERRKYSNRTWIFDRTFGNVDV